MFDYLKGKLAEVDPAFAVVDVNGIGYKILIPINIYSDLLLKTEALLYTTFVVREDAQTLYGFLTKEQRNTFDLLNTVSGIGPKSALSLLGNIQLDHFYSAIANADTRLINKVPGIGKKTAERLIIELKDKLKGKNISLPSFKNSIVSDAISALIGLGYSTINAQKAIQSVYEENTTQDISTLITKALRIIR